MAITKKSLLAQLKKGKGEVEILGIELVEKDWLINKQMELDKAWDINRELRIDNAKLFDENSRLKHKEDKLVSIIEKLVK